MFEGIRTALSRQSLELLLIALKFVSVKAEDGAIVKIIAIFE